MHHNVKVVGLLGTDVEAVHRDLAQRNAYAFQHQDRGHAFPQRRAVDINPFVCVRCMEHDASYSEEADSHEKHKHVKFDISLEHVCMQRTL
jgi:hypothetical protein